VICGLQREAMTHPASSIEYPRRMLVINDRLSIDESELDWEFARSSGPGGQNVNKVETKVTLRFDVDASRSLRNDQKNRITERLATRITRDGVLRVTSQRHRTREANRHAAIARFIELIDDALTERTARKPTKVSRAAKKRRLENKKRRSQKKALRRLPAADD
jgi:ribosome-associated protein